MALGFLGSGTSEIELSHPITRLDRKVGDITVAHLPLFRLHTIYEYLPGGSNVICFLSCPGTKVLEKFLCPWKPLFV